MQSDDLLELGALFDCAGLATCCERRLFAGLSVYHFQYVNGALVEYFATIAKHACRCCELASDLTHGIGFLFVVAK
jgi:hypothetical protein